MKTNPQIFLENQYNNSRSVVKSLKEASLTSSAESSCKRVKLLVKAVEIGKAPEITMTGNFPVKFERNSKNGELRQGK